MRNLLFVLLLLLAVGASNAENYTIKMLNTTSINIDGKLLHIGDAFNESAKINWSSDKQAMKVLSETNKIYIITPKLFKQMGVRKFSDFIATTKAATVRATEDFPVSVDDHRNVLSGDFVLMDSLSIKIGWKVDEKSYFIAEKNENEKAIRIPHRNGYLIFTPSLFGRSINEDNPFKITIKYVEEEYNETTLITNDMRLIIVPIVIE